MRRETLIIIASILVSLIFLVLVLRDVPLADVGAALRQANFSWVLFGFVMVVFSIWTRAVRWRGLLNNRISLRDALYLMGITFMLNQLPLRVGEVARGLFVTQRDVPFMTAATSIVIERVLDILIVVLMIAVAVPFLPDAPQQVTQGAVIFGIIGVAGFGILLFFAYMPQVAHRILDFFLRILPFLSRLPLADWLDHTLEGLRPLTHWRTFAHAIVWTLISWITSLFTLLALLRALNIETNYWLMSFLGVALASLSIAIPVSVAAIGLFEGAVILAGELVGIDTVSATALGFLYHGNAVLGYIVVGAVGMFSLGISIGDVFKRDELPDKS
ncbi:MAG: lysylphosphatidylglycerol synthase transmembrane domain-containing protein [Anaerolineae bacterium]|nr:lysylphosphatidylglycerol synthase transmembrane domain-containing protein [Anaerolineae bacterium]